MQTGLLPEIPLAARANHDTNATKFSLAISQHMRALLRHTVMYSKGKTTSIIAQDDTNQFSAHFNAFMGIYAYQMTFLYIALKQRKQDR